MMVGWDRTSLVALLLFAGVAGSGCLGEDNLPEAAMEDLHAMAVERARAWRPGAFLSSVGSLEAASLRAIEDDSVVQNPFVEMRQVLDRGDPHVGNALSVYWHFEFTDPETDDRLSLAFLADGDEQAHLAEFKSAAQVPRDELGLSSKISGTAAFAAAARAVDFDRILSPGEGDDTDPFMMTALMRAGEGILSGFCDEDERLTGDHWIFAAFGPSKVGVAIVDASTGQLVGEDTKLFFCNFLLEDLVWAAGFGGPDLVLHEDAERGRLTPLEREFELPIPVSQAELNGRPVWLHFELCAPAGWPAVHAGRFDWSISAPNGTRMVFEDVDSPVFGPPRTGALQAVEGDYLFRVALHEQTGVALDYDVRVVVDTRPPISEFFFWFWPEAIFPPEQHLEDRCPA